MSSSDDEPAWVVEQASAEKPRRGPPSSSGESASLGAEEPPAMPDDASDLWSQSGDGQPAQEDEGEEDEAEAGASQEAAKPKGKAPKAPPASRLPFVLAPKVRRDILLFESTDASLDLSGDSGTIGRLRVHSTAGGGKSGGGVAGGSSAAPHGEHALTLDLKGKVFDGDVVPCNTLCIVSIDGKQAKVEAVCSDYVRLGAPRGSIFDMETVQEGDFGDDFFDDDDDAGGVNEDEDEELGPLKEKGRGGKSGGKAKGKASGKSKAKGKAAGGGGGGSKPKRPAPAAKAPAAKKAKAS